QVNFVEDTIEMDIAVKPFQNVDKFLGILPLPGQLSGGKENSLVAAFYHVSGTLKDPKVTPLPMKSLGRNTIGVFRRLLFIPDALPGQ
ncbi:MAG TPA: hypothetical protein VN648_00700, partial [Candidatus Methylomirabilis sp.]|nr:hypothetical protein [Candidatus Methylomirabilis sp.]